MSSFDRTHHRDARSWVDSANASGADFPVQNLPLGVFRRKGETGAFRGGVAIGDQIVDLGQLAASNLFSGASRELVELAAKPVLDDLLARERSDWRTLRHALFDLLVAGSPAAGALARHLVPQAEAELGVPTSCRDYTDFYTSLDHATNIGKLFGIERPAPSFFSQPIAYHGRSSTLVASGAPVVRPWGQVTAAPGRSEHRPTAKLDYEMELGAFVGKGNRRGRPIPLSAAEDHLFGLCLLNDWSARDIQAWELAPLGPFNAKNFATTVSPWIVTLEALAPYRGPAPPRAEGQPPVLPYLRDDTNEASGALAVEVEVWIEPAGGTAERLTKASFASQYWTFAQMVTQHTVGGCSLRHGDLLGSGTISGPARKEAGALMELTADAAEPVTLANGQRRGYLEDGDTIILKAFCEAAGAVRIGFGECRGTIYRSTDDARID